MYWFPFTLKRRNFHYHTLVKHDEIHVEFIRRHCENYAALNIYKLEYRQSICLECGKKFKYELINESYLHTMTENGSKIEVNEEKYG